MKFNYNKIPEKTKLVHALNYKKINGEAKNVDLEDPDLFKKMNDLGWKMVKTCVCDNGVGLAAPQLGIPRKVFVMVDFEQDGLWKFCGTMSLYINPVITPIRDTERVMHAEGCLSVPGKQLKIFRPKKVEVSYWYFDDKGKLKQSTKEVLDGFPARIFQHEYDHLFGMDIVKLNERQNLKPKRGRPKGSKNSKTVSKVKADKNKKTAVTKKKPKQKNKKKKN